jgi:SsrA-binding protein
MKNLLLLLITFVSFNLNSQTILFKGEVVNDVEFNMYIEEYAFGHHFNHNPKSERRLLLNKRELRSLKKDVEAKGNAIVPLKLFLNERGFAKLEIALAKGKKTHDKREVIKERDNKVDLARIKKSFNA